jgi:DNA-binding LacI/PurR family transcriptional regulator
MEKKKTVSSRDVAREAGVSQATVSYILNETKNVRIKPETREAVLEAVRKLNYHPNQIARGMRLNRSMSIGIITERNVTNFYFMKTLEGIRDVAQKRNYSITLLFDKSDGRAEDEFIRYYESRRLDGVIFVFASPKDDIIDYMYDSGIPFVIVDAHPVGQNVHQVCTDHLGKVCDVIGLFKAKMAKKIGYVGPIPKNARDERTTVFRYCLEQSGYTWDDDLITLSVHEENEIIKNITAALDTPSRPDALLAGTPRFGLFAARCAQGLGIKVPDDLKIVALGTSNFYNVAYPPITAVELPLYDMGVNSADMLIGSIDGTVVKERIVLPSELIIRQST